MNQCKTTLALLNKGWLTALGSAQHGGVLSLSQRVGEWRRDGLTIIDKWITTPAGARIKAYKVVRRGKA